MQLSHRPGSLTSAVRRLTTATEDWLSETRQGLALKRADLQTVRLASMERVATVTQARGMAAQEQPDTQTRQMLIYRAERRLQLAHAINDRSLIASIHAELDQLL
jgi:hypothetical protein